MLLSAMEDFRLNNEETIYIGDADKDLEAAQAAGIQGILLGKNHNSGDNYLDLGVAIPRIKDLLERVK
jgi:phosphoglycolate phosphatase-like HAD superfamily hydrolase